MINLSKLKEIFSGEKRKCTHEYPKKLTLVDTIDREGKFTRISFCTECDNYRWDEVKKENWDGEFLSRLRTDQYHVYATLEELSTLRQFWKK